MSEDPEEVVIGWSPIQVTLGVSFAQGLVFFFLFAFLRKKEMKANRLDIYEKRHLTRGHRSPPIWDGKEGMVGIKGRCFGWIGRIMSITNKELLRCVGLDSYMYLRFLRLGFRVSAFGTLLGCGILIPIYATGKADGPSTEEFNSITMARVKQGSNRLWAPAVCWVLFVAFVLGEIWKEWEHYAVRRSEFLSKGDADTAPDFRYAILVENIPKYLRSNKALFEYFERLFPGKVRQVTVCINTSNLDKLVAERRQCILSYEKADAYRNAKPNKPIPTVKTNQKAGCCGGNKVNATECYREEIIRLNEHIDTERELLWHKADSTSSEDDTMSSTAFVTFVSLRAKQAAVQCELSGKVDNMETFAAPEPNGVIWENVPVPINIQRHSQKVVSIAWTVGVLFWALPVSFITSIANLNGILTAVGLSPWDESSFHYGLIAGLLPVIFLQILMIVLYLSIGMSASKIIRKKSWPEVDSYTFYWHMLYQFANLWLILIGGSAFNQFDKLIKDPKSILNVLAAAMPAQSTFFINMAILGSFAQFGLELSQIINYVIREVTGLIFPKATRTQRALDTATKPTAIKWGKCIPPVIFIFLVTTVYVTITPIVEMFAAVYFGGNYLVWCHQCLHVYAQEFEGGGKPVWEFISTFIFVCLFMAEGIFFAYMGIKEGPSQAIVGIIAVVATIIVRSRLNRNIVRPLQNLALSIAAGIDIDDGEIEVLNDDKSLTFQFALETQLYGQPTLKLSNDERDPLPYRRELVLQGNAT